MPCGIPMEKSLTKETVITALKKHGGVYLHACEELHVARRCFSKYVHRHPDLVELVKELRHDYDEEMQDAAVSVFKKLIAKADDDPAHAFKSAQYYLNNKGRKRGYAHPDAEKNDSTLTAAQAMAVSQRVEEELKKRAEKSKPKKKPVKRKVK